MNKTLTLVSTALIFCGSLSLFAQWNDADYDFSTFVLPDIHYKTLQFSAALDGSTHRFDDGNVFPERTLNDFDAGGNLNYFRFVNTAEKQYSNSFNFSLFEQWNRYQDEETFRNFSFESRLLGTQHFRWYKGRRFKEFSLLHSTRIAPSSLKNQQSTTNELSAGIHLRPFFFFGKGRLEPITDVTIAHFLLRELAQSGLLTSEISGEELNALGQQMARSRNKRIFDTREKRKYEISSIDSLITNQQWVNGYSIDYFTILADNWLYDLRNARNQGNRLSYGIGPHIYYQIDREKRKGPIIIDSKSDSRVINLYAIIQYEVQKPVTVSRQRSYGGSLIAGYEIYDLETNPFLDDDRFPVANVTGYYGLGFYPNSRTRWTNYLEAVFRTQSLEDQFGHSLHLGLSSSLTYYLSPRAQISGNFSAFWTTADNFIGSISSGFPLIIYASPNHINAIVDRLNGHTIGADLNVNFVYQLF